MAIVGDSFAKPLLNALEANPQVDDILTGDDYLVGVM